MRKHGLLLITSVLITSLIQVPAFAHGGRTDANGGHYDRSTGIYHYHNGGSSSSSSSSGTYIRESTPVTPTPVATLAPVPAPTAPVATPAPAPVIAAPVATLAPVKAPVPVLTTKTVNGITYDYDSSFTAKTIEATEYVYFDTNCFTMIQESGRLDGYTELSEGEASLLLSGLVSSQQEYFESVVPQDLQRTTAVGVPAWDISFQAYGGKGQFTGDFNFRSIVFVWNSAIYSVSYISPQALYDTNLEKFETVVASLRLLPAFSQEQSSAAAPVTNVQPVPLDTPVTVDQFQYKIRVLPPDIIGTIWMETEVTNNSAYPIKSFQLTVLDKSTNEKGFLSTYDTVMPGGTSPVFDTLGPESGNLNDIEILITRVTLVTPGGESVFVDYDHQLKTYDVLGDW